MSLYAVALGFPFTGTHPNLNPIELHHTFTYIISACPELVAELVLNVAVSEQYRLK